MIEMKTMRAAMLRMSSIDRMQYQYDPAGAVFGEGPIHFLIEVEEQLFVAWEDKNTGTMIVNPVTRFELDELEELGSYEAWTVLLVPASVTEGIQFREIDNAELRDAYLRAERLKRVSERASIATNTLATWSIEYILAS